MRHGAIIPSPERVDGKGVVLSQLATEQIKCNDWPHGCTMKGDHRRGNSVIRLDRAHDRASHPEGRSFRLVGQRQEVCAHQQQCRDSSESDARQIATQIATLRTERDTMRQERDYLPRHDQGVNSYSSPTTSTQATMVDPLELERRRKVGACYELSRGNNPFLLRRYFGSDPGIHTGHMEENTSPQGGAAVARGRRTYQPPGRTSHDSTAHRSAHCPSAGLTSLTPQHRNAGT